jgi:gamma-glutamyltranspeptidase/glutathione hydrolase
VGSFPLGLPQRFCDKVFTNGTMYPGDLGLESRIPESTREALAARGHKVRVLGPWTQGSNAAIMFDWENGVLSAAADPCVEAYAWAW